MRLDSVEYLMCVCVCVCVLLLIQQEKSKYSEMNRFTIDFKFDIYVFIIS